MKNKWLKLTCCFLAMMATTMFFSCTDKDDDPDTRADVNGDVRIDYVRMTEPEVSDSLLTGSFLGGLIAIVGDNLGDTKELWFNDQKARLNPSFITDNSIVVSVPTDVPAEVTNEMRLIDSEGNVYTHPFVINVPAPRLNNIKSEFVPDGGIVVLNGDFFFDPIQVDFANGENATIETLSKTQIRVIVPEGVDPGKIIITTNFGSAVSDFIFRDDRNTILDFDNLLHETWTSRIGFEDTQIEPTSGSFSYFESGEHGEWQWVNEMTMQYWSPRGRGDVPISTGFVGELVFKMEVNVPVEWKDIRMEIFFSPSAEDHGRDASGTAMARWQPWQGTAGYTTDGWVTLEIPLSEFVYNKDDGDDNPTAGIDNLASLSNVTMMMFGPASTTSSNPVFIAFDNLRVVPKN